MSMCRRHNVPLSLIVHQFPRPGMSMALCPLCVDRVRDVVHRLEAALARQGIAVEAGDWLRQLPPQGYA